LARVNLFIYNLFFAGLIFLADLGYNKPMNKIALLLIALMASTFVVAIAGLFAGPNTLAASVARFVFSVV
jgi:hypothetical protein